jgi:hypothetical protein
MGLRRKDKIMRVLLPVLIFLAAVTTAFAQTELVTNGDFSAGTTGWDVNADGVQPYGTGGYPKMGWLTIQVIPTDGSYTNVLEIQRTGGDAQGAWTGLGQTLNVDVTGWTELYLEADVKPMYQSLGGGGWVGGEYPVHLVVDYFDADGIWRTWFGGWFDHGFYYLGTSNYPATSTWVAQNTWYHYTSPNILNIMSPRPAVISRVLVMSSGWSYQGRMDNISLWGTPPVPPTIYNWLGFLPPIVDAHAKPFKRGSTIPVKFRISNTDGQPAPDAVATLTIYYLENGAPSGEAEVVSTAAGDWGNQFRYDASGDYFIFNLSTKHPSFIGYYTYQAEVTLDDGQIFTTDFSLK